MKEAEELPISSTACVRGEGRWSGLGVLTGT